MRQVRDRCSWVGLTPRSDVGPMTMIVRREAVLGVTLTILACAARCSHAAVARPQDPGCCIPAGRAQPFLARAAGAQVFSTGNEKLVRGSGSSQLDYALAQTLSMLSKRFGVLPAFSYYEEAEGEGANARATERRLLDRTDGTVLLGLSMLSQLLQSTSHRDAAIVAVCAHEFGHVVAIKRGLQGKLVADPGSPFRGEQFADYMSGFFAGLRQLEEPEFPAVAFAATMRDLGGDVRGTHGTRMERGRAVVEGFKAAKAGSPSIDAAVEGGYRFAMAA